MQQTTLSRYVKAMRKQYDLTQVDLSEKSGVGLRFAWGWSRANKLFGCEVDAIPFLKTPMIYETGDTPFLRNELSVAHFIRIVLPLIRFRFPQS